VWGKHPANVFMAMYGKTLWQCAYGNSQVNSDLDHGWMRTVGLDEN
jgi:hypothetical protein